MSLALMKLSWEIRGLTASVKLVLLKLADNSSDEGVAYPSVSTIARLCDLHRASVLRAFEVLEECGHMTRQQRQGRSTIYLVHPKVDPSQDATGTRSNLLPVAICYQSQSATPPVAGCDTPRRRMRRDPSQSATHNLLLTSNEPSEESQSRTPELQFVDPGPHPTDPIQDWRTRVPGIHVPAFERWLHYLAFELRPPKILPPITQVRQAKKLATYGAPERQERYVERAIDGGWKEIYPGADLEGYESGRSGNGRRTESFEDAQRRLADER